MVQTSCTKACSYSFNRKWTLLGSALQTATQLGITATLLGLYDLRKHSDGTSRDSSNKSQKALPCRPWFQENLCCRFLRIFEKKDPPLSTKNSQVVFNRYRIFVDKTGGVKTTRQLLRAAKGRLAKCIDFIKIHWGFPSVHRQSNLDWCLVLQPGTWSRKITFRWSAQPHRFAFKKEQRHCLRATSFWRVDGPVRLKIRSDKLAKPVSWRYMLS